ncbi:MAG: ring-cleaving dioxygenase [Balneolaceae bacterium]|nr:ring-cleaving dioxygenase [Balneolaceae bacterium]
MKHHNGIHHITVLAGDPQRNAEFYVNTLGMRMVKKSVNQDDPGTYHLFYGNQAATPGSSLTFFPWPRAVKGEPGTGEAVTVAFSVPENSLQYWQQRLEKKNVQSSDPFTRFGLTVLPFQDPDGLNLELVFEDITDAPSTDREGVVPSQHAIRGFWGISLRLTEKESTASVLQDILGFEETDQENNITRYMTDAPIGGTVLIEITDQQSGKNGRGIVHHVAFRAADEDHLADLRKQVQAKRLMPTEIIDRHWFKSVYYRVPAGVLFEMASDGPGYAVDEDPDHLGEKLILPPWLESKREQIENHLPEITV